MNEFKGVFRKVEMAFDDAFQSYDVRKQLRDFGTKMAVIVRHPISDRWHGILFHENGAFDIVANVDDMRKWLEGDGHIGVLRGDTIEGREWLAR